MGVPLADADRLAVVLAMMLCDERCSKEEAVEAAYRIFPREEGPER